MKPRLISGIKPSGSLHLGNYLGALENFVELQNGDQYDCFFFIADLHSITEDFDPATHKKEIFDLIVNYLAAGLTPSKSTIFIQSHIPAHSELCWILNTITPFGELARMTQFKDKSDQNAHNINVGLFDYPVLMAADIILYDAAFVPVGDDQLQHLEFTRALARKFNSKFSETFIEPQPLLTKTPRVMSLHDPLKKMSKSQPEGCIFLDNTPEEIERKIMGAVTDSGAEIKYDPQTKSGIANLLDIYSALSGEDIPTLEQKFAGKKYVTFKKATARLIAKKLAPIRRRREKLLSQTEKIMRIAYRGNKIAGKIAEEKIKTIKERVGFV